MSMSGRSPIDSLRRLAPATNAEAVAAFGVAGREALLESVTEMPFGRPRPAARRAPSRRRLALAAAGIAVAAIATAATWVALRGGLARETTSVQCLIDGNDTVIPSTSGDPAHDCAIQWKRDFGTKPPALVAYDNTLGGVTVLARSQKPPRGWTVLHSQDVALIELQDSLDDYVAGLNSSCLDGKAATALAGAKLARFGFRGWTVTVRSGDGACVSGDVVDPVARTVTLIPTDRPGRPETPFQKLAARLRPIAARCETLPNAVAAVRAAAAGLPYQLNPVEDDSLRCASIYETVGGTIFLTVRGATR
jgi:hypothetical protein